VIGETAGWLILAGCLTVDLFALAFVLVYWPKGPFDY
jgi:hypothetical protein